MDVRAYAPGDEAAILRLFDRSFGKPLPEAFWRWRFLDDPHGAPMIELAWDGDVLAAHYAVSPTSIAVEGERRVASLSMTTMTDPDYRGHGLFGQLATRLYERLAGVGHVAVFGFPNAQSHRGFIRDLGWQDVHEIPMLRLEVASAKPIERGRRARRHRARRDLRCALRPLSPAAADHRVARRGAPHLALPRASDQ